MKLIVLLPLIALGACTMTTPSKECLKSRALQSDTVKQSLEQNNINADATKSITNSVVPVNENACTQEELDTLNSAQVVADIFN